MTAVSAANLTAPSDRVGSLRSAGAFGGVAAAVWLVVAASAAWLPGPRTARTGKWGFFPGQPWLGGWVHFDGWWYRSVALHGYSFHPGRPSAVAFFPSYPLLMRVVGLGTGNVLVAGIAITVSAGLIAAVLFDRWASEKIGEDAAWCGLALLLVYPYAFYLYGAVYSDALFLAAAIGAFALLEHDHPVWAGLVGIVALAGRPVGLALLLGLTLRAFELRHAARPPVRSRPLRLGGVMVALVGLVAWCGYLWERFDDPFVFVAAERGWNQSPGLRTWFKIKFFEDLVHIHKPIQLLLYLAHPAVTLIALGLVPLVWRRLGPGYGSYTAAVLLIPAVSTSNFWSMGRYTLAAFPCFAVVGAVIAGRPRAHRLLLLGSAELMLVLSSLYARAIYVA